MLGHLVLLNFNRVPCPRTCSDESIAQNADIGDILQQVPSTFIRRLGGLGSFSSVSIRGSSARQSTMYIDGIPLNPEGLSAINLSELPLHAFQQIDVYRSQPPLSLLDNFWTAPRQISPPCLGPLSISEAILFKKYVYVSYLDHDLK